MKWSEGYQCVCCGWLFEVVFCAMATHKCQISARCRDCGSIVGSRWPGSWSCRWWQRLGPSRKTTVCCCHWRHDGVGWLSRHHYWLLRRTLQRRRESSVPDIHDYKNTDRWLWIELSVSNGGFDYSNTYVVAWEESNKTLWLNLGSGQILSRLSPCRKMQKDVKSLATKVCFLHTLNVLLWSSCWKCT